MKLRRDFPKSSIRGVSPVHATRDQEHVQFLAKHSFACRATPEMRAAHSWKSLVQANSRRACKLPCMTHVGVDPGAPTGPGPIFLGLGQKRSEVCSDGRSRTSLAGNPVHHATSLCSASNWYGSRRRRTQATSMLTTTLARRPVGALCAEPGFLSTLPTCSQTRYSRP